MDNKKYFYFSGFLSLLLLCLFAFIFIVMLFHVQDMKRYGLKKKSYISVSIAVKPTKVKVIHTKKSSNLSSSVPIASEKKSVTKDIDLQTLFSDVWTQKITHKIKKREINSKRISEIQKQIKLQKTLPIPIKKKNFDKEQNEEKQKQENSTISANEVNEYLAKIQSLVYQYFHVPPNTEGNSVKTVIVLDTFGKVIDFRVLHYSASEALNREVDRMKKRLKNVVFPINPQGETSQTVVVLISKE